MYMIHDEDEWETVVTSGGQSPYTGWLNIGQRRRAPEEVKRIKADRLRKEEDEILRRADEIRTRRGLVSGAAR